jgi:hypothetical protein
VPNQRRRYPSLVKVFVGHGLAINGSVNRLSPG